MPHPENPSAAPDAASGPPAGRFRREAAETVQTLVAAMAIAVALQTAVFQPFTIPTSSMEPGLATGDYIVASKFTLGWSRASFPFNPPLFRGRVFGRAPARGEVVVFRLPRNPQEIWVKRVIGLPGDRVQVRGGTVVVNGRGLPRTPLGVTGDHDAPARAVLQVRETGADGRSYLTYDRGAGHEGDDTGVWAVPQGHYFVMGDNRDNSLDSRWPRQAGVGMLPAENIVGRAEMVVLSWRPGAALLKPWTWLNLQTDRFFQRVR